MKEQILLSSAHRLLNGGCMVLISVTAKGRTNVMPAAWVAPVSMRPPLVAASVAVTSFTHELIARSNEFVLNVPGADLVKQVKEMGTVSGRDLDKLKQTWLLEHREMKPLHHVGGDLFSVLERPFQVQEKP